ncbi:MAG TPA: formate dehydrogenase subunit gamma [Hyphomicrobiaceae bacterium]|nr:formate dehydrogenase subunit gamma [Hyphomicrobiaceae bacterium]
MSRLIELARALALAIPIALFAGAAPVSAQTPVPKQVNPTAESVKEDQLLKELQRIEGRITIPDKREAVLIQPAGRDWREWRQSTLPRIGTIAIIGMLALLILFLIVRGRVRLENGFSGRTVQRFTAVERFGHWLTATSFIVLGLTGLNVTFGRDYLLPVVGAETFTFLSQWAKYLHNYMSFAFVLGLVIIFFAWVIYNLPTARDFRWIAEGGGIIGNKHPPAAKFNAGQKLVFWVTILGGLTLTITGYMLMFPFYSLPSTTLTEINTSIAAIQNAQVIHAVVGLIMIAIILAHIYIGTIGMEGAFSSMSTGEVDENWARQHHSVWAERVASPEGGGRTVPAE